MNDDPNHAIDPTPYDRNEPIKPIVYDAAPSVVMVTPSVLMATPSVVVTTPEVTILPAHDWTGKPAHPVAGPPTLAERLAAETAPLRAEIARLTAERDTYRAFAVRLATALASPGAEDLAAKIGLGDLDHLAEQVASVIGRGPDANLIAHAPTDLAALLAYVRELEAEVAWHEDRSGTRAEQEQQDAEWAADDAKMDAMSDDEIRASLEASGVRVDDAIRRSDALIRVCTERAALSAQVDRLTADRDRLALTLRCERGEWAPEGWTAKIRGDHLRFVRNGSVRPGRTCDVVQHGGDHAIRWHWWDRTIDSDGEATATHGDGYAPTALEAIEAADAAIREVSGG